MQTFAEYLLWQQVSVDAKHVVAERDQLVAKVRQLEAAAAARVAGQRRKSLDQAVEEEGGEWKPLGLIRKLAQKQDELRQTQVEFLHPIRLQLSIKHRLVSANSLASYCKCSIQI